MRGDRSVVVQARGGDKKVLRLHVAMKVARLVYVVETLYDLAKDRRDQATSQRFTFAGLDELVQVALHGLKDEVELFGVREEEEVVERNNVRVIGNRAERLS